MVQARRVGRAVAAFHHHEAWRKVRARRAGCQVIPGGREPTESATESRPPKHPSWVPVRVKRCGKSAPRQWQHATAWQTPPGARPNREVAVPQGAAARARACFRVGRLRRAATYVPEEWLLSTEPG